MSFISNSISLGRFNNYLPAPAQAISGIMRKIGKMAIPIIVLLGATQLDRAEAGPAAYAACIAACAAMPPVCVGGGWAACLAALALPGP